MRKLKTLGVGTVGAALLLLGTPLAAGAAPADGQAAAAATPGTLLECETLTGFEFENTVITAANRIAAGAETNAGTPVGEHCQVTGYMNERESEVDGQTYRIGFEMRLPADWSGRYLYQANGGIDGSVVKAMGSFTGGQLENGLQQGFVVLSSDAGHQSPAPFFGNDPQARLDYGYQAVGTLTPMAKSLIEAAYDRGPDYSYIAGGSNGGRHTMVAAARYADMYDGFFAIAPGYNLPKAAVAQIWGAQQWLPVANNPDDLTTALSAEERAVVSAAILEQCDAADGLEDGMVHNGAACQELFNVEEHVPTCETERDGTCLTAEQKSILERVFAGATTSTGEAIYSSFPYDPGIANADWAAWKFRNSLNLDPGAVNFIFNTPPGQLGNALTADIDALAAGIWATDDIYTESAMEFMTPPNPTELSGLYETGGKLLVVHGASDAVFSSDDTAAWYNGLTENYGAETMDFARYFEVPGMAHVRGGMATDQFDGLGAIVQWVEQGIAPDSIVASARGEGNPGGVNAEVPADWSADRTRLLCPYPAVSTYVEGDVESAASFECVTPTVETPEPEPQPEPEPEPGETPAPDEPGPEPGPEPGTEPTGDASGETPQGQKGLAETGMNFGPMIAGGALALIAGVATVLIAARKKKHEA